MKPFAIPWVAYMNAKAKKEPEMNFPEELSNEVLATVLDELAGAVAAGPEAVRRRFDMRIPAEPDRDADLVMSEAARRLRAMAWRPISSAPRDGTEVLVSYSGLVERPFIATFDGYWSDALGVQCSPTHWLPLPPPPAGRGGG